MSSLKNGNSESIGGVIVSWRPWVRLWVGLFVCALGALYTNNAVVAVFGPWRNTFFQWGMQFSCSLPLVLTNAVGYRAKRLGVANLVLAALLVAYHVWSVGFMTNWQLRWTLWPLLVSLVLWPLLNWYFFRSWCRAAELD